MSRIIREIEQEYGPVPVEKLKYNGTPFRELTQDELVAIIYFYIRHGNAQEINARIAGMCDVLKERMKGKVEGYKLRDEIGKLKGEVKRLKAERPWRKLSFSVLLNLLLAIALLAVAL